MPKISIGISVGTEKFEMPIWMETFQFACAKAAPCGTVTLEICDTLQRHTLALFNHEIMRLEAQLLEPTNKDQFNNIEITKIKNQIQIRQKEIYNRSLANGQNWIQTKITANIVKMRKIAKEFGVTLIENWHRWDQWKNHKDFNKWREKVDALYQDDNDFCQTMKCSIEHAKERFKRFADYPTTENTGIPQEILEIIINKYCYDYLSEEAAGVIGLWQEQEYNMIVYPDKEIPVLQEARKHFIPAERSNLLHWQNVSRKIPDPPARKFIHSFIALFNQQSATKQTENISPQAQQQIDACLKVFLQTWDVSEDNDNLQIPIVFLQQFTNIIRDKIDQPNSPITLDIPQHNISRTPSPNIK